MFELLLVNNRGTEKRLGKEIFSFYNSELHEYVFFEDKNIQLYGLKYISEKGDNFQNDSFRVLIFGKIFYKNEYHDVSCISADKILEMYIESGSSFKKYIKGNYIIFIYDVNNNLFKIFVDSLGLKFLYYYQSSGSYIISTNLSLFKLFTFEYDNVSIVEKIIFEYPISNNTYLKNVKLLDMGNVITVNQGKLVSENHEDILSLFPGDLSNLTKFDVFDFIEIFNKAVVQRSNVSPQINLSLTGGFDGRAVLSTLLMNNVTPNCYSFGKKGGENTRVPINVSNLLKLKYKPVYLDDEYVLNYSDLVKEAIYMADGLSINERANYIFAMKSIASTSRYNITGLIAEMFGAVNLIGGIFNKNYFNYFYLGKQLSIVDMVKEVGLSSLIDLSILDDKSFQNELLHRMSQRKREIDLWKESKDSWNYYVKDLLTLGIRRFYGSQMHIERYYCENLTPFYDYDVLSYLFNSTYQYIYKNSFKRSPFVRKNNRYLQSMIIKHNYPRLGEIPLDRGYSSNYMFDFRILLVPYYFYKRMLMLKRQPSDFDSPHWVDIFYKDILKSGIRSSSGMFNIPNVLIYLEKYSPKEYKRNFSHLLSIMYWVHGKTR